VRAIVDDERDHIHMWLHVIIVPESGRQIHRSVLPSTSRNFFLEVDKLMRDSPRQEEVEEGEPTNPTCPGAYALIIACPHFIDTHRLCVLARDDQLTRNHR
jgi:hypothetical protein